MLRTILLACAVCAATGGATVAFAADDEVKGDIEYGEYLSAECVTCHQVSGKDNGIPSITGWDPESFVSVMEGYKNKDLENPAMQLIAGRLDGEQLASLAVYFGSLPEAEE